MEAAKLSIIKCAQCGAALTPPGPFANQVTCGYCGCTTRLDAAHVPVARFRAALERWNDPERYGFADWISAGGGHWTLDRRLAAGPLSEVHAGRRARWPSESVVLKISNDPAAAARHAAERAVLDALQDPPRGLGTPPRLFLPEPVACGPVSGGGHALIYRAVPRMAGTFEDALRAYPRGVPGPVGVWMWRRILEALAYVHRSGLVHGAIVPPHLLVERHDHGVRLVGFGRAGHPDAAARPLPPEWAAFEVGGERSPAADLAMSARAVAWVLGGDPASGAVPATVPAAFADLIAQVAAGGSRDGDAWTLRNRVGATGQAAFGPPRFVPLALPEDGR